MSEATRPGEAVDALRTGAVVGRYRLEAKLGEGGAGSVFAAVHVTSGQRVALKILRGELIADAATIERFEREARALRDAKHPGIVDVLDTGRLEDGRPFLVLSLLQGMSLRARLDAERHLTPEEAWSIARDVASAIGRAHDVGITHRDLKPENIFLEEQPGAERARVRVLDFGIAKIAETSGAPANRLTATGAPIGTPAYMAPEQWWAADVGPRVDQYALGIVLFEMLVGRPPFASPAFAELIQLHVGEPAPTLLAKGVHVRQEIEAFVARLLAKEPGDRFASMAALIEAGDRAFLVAATAPVASLADRSSDADLEPESELVRGFTGARALQRFFSVHAAILILGFAAIVLAGYGDKHRHDVLEWLRVGGWSGGIILLYVPFAAYALAEIARARADTGRPSIVGYLFALAPALQGTFGAMSEWRAVVQRLPQADATEQLRYLGQGAYDANVGRFLGFSATALLFLSLSALPGISGMTHASATLSEPRGLRPPQALLVTAVLALFAIIAALSGAASTALVLGVLAAGFGVRAAIPTLNGTTATRDELERRAALWLAFFFMSAVAVTRLDAHAAILWAESATRADRVAGFIAVAGERALLLTPAACLAALLDLVTAMLLPGRARWLRPSLRVVALAALVAAVGVADVAERARFVDKQNELIRELADQFKPFAQLDPPSGDALEGQGFVAHRATALQVTLDAVALDGRGVVTLPALWTDEGRERFARDLDHAIATAALERRGHDGVELSVSVDRMVDAKTVVRLLRVAASAGVRHAEILLTRGASPERELAADGPPELLVVVPQDFVALPIELGAKGFVLVPDTPFASATERLVVEALAAHGPVPVDVGVAIDPGAR